MAKFNPKTILFVIAVFFIVVLPACWPWGKSKAQSKLKDLVVINVLDKEQYDDCHIKGSIHVDFERVVQFVQERVEPTAEVVLYCSNYMCSASGFARESLEKSGRRNVWVYEGGTAEWFQLGYPVEGPAKESSYLTAKIAPPEHQESYVLSAQELKKKIDERDSKKES